MKRPKIECHYLSDYDLIDPCRYGWIPVARQEDIDELEKYADHLEAENKQLRELLNCEIEERR